MEAHSSRGALLESFVVLLNRKFVLTSSNPVVRQCRPSSSVPRMMLCRFLRSRGEGMVGLHGGYRLVSLLGSVVAG
jgi:hypothetical protein